MVDPKKLKEKLDLKSSRQSNSVIVETDVMALLSSIEDWIELLPLLHILHISMFIEFDERTIQLDPSNLGFSPTEEDNEVYSKQISDIIITENGNTLVEVMYMINKDHT